MQGAVIGLALMFIVSWKQRIVLLCGKQDYVDTK